ncbi:MAG TPA: hypothetical protein VF395_02030 [Polyangiaceae bacterium]
MTDNRKTIVAAGVLAAAVGVYLEISFREKVEIAERARRLSGAPSASASASAASGAAPRRAPSASGERSLRP